MRELRDRRRAVAATAFNRRELAELEERRRLDAGGNTWGLALIDVLIDALHFEREQRANQWDEKCRAIRRLRDAAASTTNLPPAIHRRDVQVALDLIDKALAVAEFPGHERSEVAAMGISALSTLPIPGALDGKEPT